MLETPANCKTRIREAVATHAANGLDKTVAEIEAALVTAWTLQRKGSIAPRDVQSFVESVESALKKLAPPPPKKIKFSDPLRKILPLAETSVKPALDVALFLMGLTQVGDFSEQTDKKRKDHELFMDDWRRMIWESARVRDWPKFRELVTREERVIEGRLSRDTALQVLEAIQKRREDNITPVPDLSMLACDRCGRFQGRDRVRCHSCNGTFCTRCISPVADLCLVDYAVRYAVLDPVSRQQVAAEVKALLKEYRLNAHARNDSFVRALREKGVDVVFLDAAPLDGQESDAPQNRRKLLMRDRENQTCKRILFGSLARAAFLAAEVEATTLLVEYFVDTAVGLLIEDAIKAAAASPSSPSAASAKEGPAPPPAP